MLNDRECNCAILGKTLMESLVTFIARYLILLPVLATLYFLWDLKGYKRRIFLMTLVATGGLSLIFAKIGAHLFYDPRPFIKDGITPLFRAAHDNGFPSDHTLLASALGFTALSYSKRWGISLLIVAALIGWARVDAGVHHLIDICGSFVFTGIAYLIVIQAQKRYFKGSPKHHKNHPKDA
jgi:undecaprenyl-diphosphatase